MTTRRKNDDNPDSYESNIRRQTFIFCTTTMSILRSSVLITYPHTSLVQKIQYTALLMGACHIHARGWSHAHGSRQYHGVRCLRTHSQSSDSTITITQPDDWHLHVRDGPGLQSVVPHSAAHFRRAIIMPNLVPPVTTAAAAMAYKSRIVDAVPKEHASSFVPLMTLYLTDNTTPDDVYEAKEQGIVAFKMYPAGATTNSDSGVTDWRKCVSTLKAMEEVRSCFLYCSWCLFRNRANMHDVFMWLSEWQ